MTIKVREIGVPDRTWNDPVLGAVMHTGADALRYGYGLMRKGIPIATDIETPGLDNNFTINCVTMAWTAPDGRTHSVLLDPRRNPDHAEAVREFYDHAGAIILHNAPFDVPPLHHAGLLTLGNIDKIIDTVVLARFAMPEPPPFGQGKKLEQLATALLGLTEFKGGMERAFKAAGFKTIQAGFEGLDIGSPIYRQGAMADTVATLRLEPVLRKMAIHWTLDHDFPSVGATTPGEAEAILGTQERVHRVMLRRSALGLNVDRAYLDRYAEQVDVERNLAIAELAVHGLEGGTGKGKALVEYLDSRGELPQPWPRTPTGNLRATKADLEVLAKVNPLAGAQRKLAVIEKVMGYLEKVDRQASVTGRCHPQVGILGASATGRWSVSQPELQQFPDAARPVIIADEDMTIWSIDWSQIEPVVMGNMARDWNFLAPYERGDDLYEPLQLAAGIDRKTSKICLLAMMYGQGVSSMARDINHTEESAAQVRRQIFSAMPRCERWMHKIEQIATDYGRIVTAGGRVLPVDRGGVFRAVNYEVQGSAADVLNNAVVEMHRRGIADHLLMGMHDELVVQGDEELSREVQEIMTTPPAFMLRWTQGRAPVFRTDRQKTGKAWAAV